MENFFFFSEKGGYFKIHFVIFQNNLNNGGNFYEKGSGRKQV